MEKLQKAHAIVAAQEFLDVEAEEDNAMHWEDEDDDDDKEREDMDCSSKKVHGCFP